MTNCFYLSHIYWCVSVENENHCDFVKLREMLICVNMEDLREQTHTRHYELYRRCKLEEMGFKDTGPECKPVRWAANTCDVQLTWMTCVGLCAVTIYCLSTEKHVLFHIKLCIVYFFLLQIALALQYCGKQHRERQDAAHNLFMTFKTKQDQGKAIRVGKVSGLLVWCGVRSETSVISRGPTKIFAKL